MSWGRWKNRTKFGVRTDPAGVAKRTRNGRVFASEQEARRYDQLILLELHGSIRNLSFQPKFDFIVTVTAPGKEDCVIEKLRYVGDFQYEENGVAIVEDVKGYETDTWRRKKKLFEKLYPEFVLRITK